MIPGQPPTESAHETAPDGLGVFLSSDSDGKRVGLFTTGLGAPLLSTVMISHGPFILVLLGGASIVIGLVLTLSVFLSPTISIYSRGIVARQWAECRAVFGPRSRSSASHRRPISRVACSTATSCALILSPMTTGH